MERERLRSRPGFAAGSGSCLRPYRLSTSAPRTDGQVSSFGSVDGDCSFQQNGPSGKGTQLGRDSDNKRAYQHSDMELYPKGSRYS